MEKKVVEEAKRRQDGRETDKVEVKG